MSALQSAAQSSEVNPTNNIEANAYDQIPYINGSYYQSSPEHLYMVGTLFNLDVPDFKTANVLEIGCANGWNTLSFATRSPDAKFTAIDLSKKQIDHANELVEKMGVNNVNFINMSIEDITPEFGQFDYIIVHGVISWVPENVREKIFEVSRDNLTKNGLVYISYNALPGWNMVKSVRDMMMYHTDNFDDPKQKVQQARLLLNFIKEGIEGRKDGYSWMVKNEFEALEKYDDNYLLHDHLEAENHPYYFKDFIDNANRYDLAYVGDADPKTMYVLNMPDSVVDTLLQVKDDVVRLEQYMDFVTNRRFRMTILTHKDNQVSRTLKLKNLEGMFVSSPYAYDKEAEVEKGLKKYSAKGKSFVCNSQPAMRILDALESSNGQRVDVCQLLKDVEKELASDKKINEAEKTTKALVTVFYTLFFKGIVDLFPVEINVATQISERPLADKWFRYSALAGSVAVSPEGRTIKMDDFSRLLAQYLDGTNTAKDIQDKMLAHIDNGDLNMLAQGKPIEDSKEKRKIIKNAVTGSLQNYLKERVLIA